MHFLKTLRLIKGPVCTLSELEGSLGGAGGGAGCSPLHPVPLHLAHPVPSPHPLPLLAQARPHPPTPTSPPALTTYMFSAFLPVPTAICSPHPGAPSPNHAFPIAACSQPAHLLEGRNHSFSPGFISLAVKCKGGSKISASPLSWGMHGGAVKCAASRARWAGWI